MAINKERKAMLLVLLCSTLWSIGGIFIKLLSINSFAIAGFRSLFAALTVGAFMVAKRYRLIVCRRSVFTGTMLSAAAFCFVTATRLTTAANAIVLEFTAPVFIMIFCAVFRRQKFMKSDVLVVVMTLTGIALCFLDGMGTGHTLGNIIGIGAGIGMAGMFIVMGDSKLEEKLSGIIIGQAITAVIGIPFFFVKKEIITPSSIFILAVLGIIQLGIPYIILAFATDSCPPFACSLLSAAEPLLNPVWVLIFDGEHPTVTALIGELIVIVSITIWCVLRDRIKYKKLSSSFG